MELSDVFQVALVSAIVFFLLGVFSRKRLGHLWSVIQRQFLSPRYLKSAGAWIPKVSSNKKS